MKKKVLSAIFAAVCVLSFVFAISGFGDAAKVAAAGYSNIEKIENQNGPTGFSGNGKIGSTSATMSVTGQNQQYGGTNWYFEVYITVDNNTEDTVTLKLSNSGTSTTALNARLEYHGQYDGTISISSVSGGTIDSSKVNVSEISAGGSQVVTMQATSNFDTKLRLRIYPVKSDSENNYIGSFTISEIFFGTPSVTKYALTFGDGVTSATSAKAGDYASGATISDIAADTAPTGKKFFKWTSSDGGSFGDETSSTTSFTMPANDTVVTPVFVDDFEMIGAGVRLDSHAGIRFGAALGEDFYTAATSAGATFGILIYPKNQLSGDAYTYFDPDFDYVAEIDKLSYSAGKTYKMNCTPAYEDTDGDGEDDAYIVKGTLSSVLYNNIDRDFFSIAYKIESGVYSYASFEDDFKRSVVGVSKTAYSGFVGNEYLDEFILKDAYKRAGYSSANYETDKAAGYTNAVLTLNKTSATVNLGGSDTLSVSSLVITGNGGEDDVEVAFSSGHVCYSSGSTSKATVGAHTGAITPVEEGETTITATLYGISATCTVTVAAAPAGKKVLNNSKLTKEERCSNGKLTFIDNGLSFQVENVGGNNYSHYVGFQIEDMEGETTVTFTFTTLNEGSFNGVIFFQPEYNQMYSASNLYTITSATNATITSVDGQSSRGAAISVAKGTPKTISITFNSGMNADGQLRVAILDHYDENLSYRISDITFG